MDNDVGAEAGVLLSLAYAVTGRLWVPIGLHLGWNFTAGFVFGTPVSGLAFPFSLLHGELRGPAVLTAARSGRKDRSSPSSFACSHRFRWR